MIPLNRTHRRSEMVELIDDEVLNAIAVVGSAREVVTEMKRRFAGVVTRTGFSGSAIEQEELPELLSSLKK